MTTIKKNTITLAEFSKNFTKTDRKYIDAEKKYYQMAIALKKQRESLKLTQEKLAKLSKIPRTTITKIESGARNTTLEMFITLAQAMGKNIELRLY